MAYLQFIAISLFFKAGIRKNHCRVDILLENTLHWFIYSFIVYKAIFG